MGGHRDLAHEQAKPRNHEAESHQGKAGSDPGEEGPLGGQIVTRRTNPSFRHRPPSKAPARE